MLKTNGLILRMNLANPAILIPAYKPSQELSTLIKNLAKQLPDHEVIVVDDGSGKDYQNIFSQLSNKNVKLITHAHNKGKGAALKTGIKWWLDQNPAAGIITADADGQHSVADISKLAQASLQSPASLHIGQRNFNKATIPLRSRFGNKLTRSLFRLLFQLKLQDTQSGLRAIPLDLLQKTLGITSDKYDFEFEMLLLAKKNKIKFNEVPIATIYIDANKSSHFNPVLDSIRIYFVFLRFFSGSLLSAAIDFIIFVIIYQLSNSIFAAIVTGRVVSGAINYFYNYRVTFQSNQKVTRSILKYIFLAVALMLCSYVGIKALHIIHINVYVAKILIESLLYFVNFYIQKHFVFAKNQTPRR